MLDWRIGGAIVGLTGGRGLCSSSVFLRLGSAAWYAALGFEAAGRALVSSSSTLFGGLAGFGGGWLIDRLNGWTEPNLDGGLTDPRSLRCEDCGADLSCCRIEL